MRGEGECEPREQKLLDRVRQATRVRHLSPKTEKTYVNWIRCYILFHGKRHPRDMGEAEINAFHTHLAVAGRVSAVLVGDEEKSAELK
ncbi:MAG: hypothetical protein QOJ16_2713 [Acidobacteriota bacterium]|jgi:hypothetical protein|nr:hypothetical protein [Acidobacteriota bacterium]